MSVFSNLFRQNRRKNPARQGVPRFSRHLPVRLPPARLPLVRLPLVRLPLVRLPLVIFLAAALILSSAFALSLAGCAGISSPAQLPEDALEVHFIDVGQADAALLLCGDASMLIDGGNVADSDVLYTYLEKHGVSELDYLVASHAHEDHVGGLSGALHYAVVKEAALCPVTEYDSAAFRNFLKALDACGAQLKVPEPGDSFALGAASVEILACNAAEGTNNSSIVLKVTHGDVSFLFTGDAERETEQWLLDEGADLSCTVLKVGHHGSESSTTYPFLWAAMPEDAVISVGSDNSYGHPTEAVLSRLNDAGVTVFRTDLNGDIICRSDGSTVTFSVKKNADRVAFPTGKGIEPIKDTENGEKSEISERDEPDSAQEAAFVLNLSSKKYHRPSCEHVDEIKEKNRSDYFGTEQKLIEMGYTACGACGKSKAPT